MKHISEEAKTELKRFHNEELFDGEFIRISRAYQCGGPKFQLSVDDSRTAMDEILAVDDLQIVVERTCLDLLKDSELHFNAEGFLFIDQLGNAC